MKLSIAKNRLWLIALYVALGLFFLFSWINIPDTYYLNYGVLLLAYVVVGGIIFFAGASNQVRLFDTFTIVSVLYLMIMVIYPLYDYIRLNLTKSGADTSSGCVKATLIFIISYVFFCAGYFGFRIHDQEEPSAFIQKVESISANDMLIIAIFCWIVAFVGCMFGQISRGFSMSYIMSMGQIEQGDIYVTSSSGGLLFLLKLMPTLIVSELMIWVYSRSLVIKVSTMTLVLMFLLMNGQRILILVIAVAPVVYWYLKRNKSPSMRTVIVTLLLLLVVFAAMQIARVSINRGRDFGEVLSERLFSVETFISVFESDFSTYKVFYGIVDAIPEKMDYLFGRGIFGYTLALVIPRNLWPGKPDAPERAVVKAAMGQLAVDNGNAYPNIGTFYSEFGIIGCVVFMWIFGRLLSKSRKLYRMQSNSALILYSCLWPYCFQLTARSISNAMYSLFFGLLPMIVAWFYSYIVSKKKKSR